MKSVLTEELLARAERESQAAAAQGRTDVGGYHKEDGLSADDERGVSEEGKKKWLT